MWLTCCAREASLSSQASGRLRFRCLLQKNHRTSHHIPDMKQFIAIVHVARPCAHEKMQGLYCRQKCPTSGAREAILTSQASGASCSGASCKGSVGHKPADNLPGTQMCEFGYRCKVAVP